MPRLKIRVGCEELGWAQSSPVSEADAAVRRDLAHQHGAAAKAGPQRLQMAYANQQRPKPEGFYERLFGRRSQMG